jgi:rare lipoprotein A
MAKDDLRAATPVRRAGQNRLAAGATNAAGRRASTWLRKSGGAGWPALAALSAAAFLAGCGSAPRAPESGDATTVAKTRPGLIGKLPLLPRAGSGRGGYYLDDGPGDDIPEGLENTPDAVPRVEPYANRGNKPYVVFGETYTPFLDDRPLKQRGRGSWYGKKFHGQRTSSGEPYDMFQMTAAHPTLPIPSYARVTNLANGRRVIVRVNDRGPFKSSRVMDLSYTAALKLGYLNSGSAELEVERLLPDEIARINGAPGNPGNAVAQTAAVAAPVVMPVAMPVVASPVAAAPPSTARQPSAAGSRAAGGGMAVSSASVPVTSGMQAVALLADAADAAQSNVITVAPRPGLTPTQAGEPAQIEIMGASTPVVEAVELPPLPQTRPQSPPQRFSGQQSPASDQPYQQPGQQASQQTAPQPSQQYPSPSQGNGMAPAQAAARPGAASGGLYLQLGAFSQPANADAARQQLAQRWGSVLPAPEVVQSGALYRLYSGPFSSRDQADAAARQLESAGLARPLVVPR